MNSSKFFGRNQAVAVINIMVPSFI